jgi:6-phosphofructokinase 1
MPGRVRANLLIAQGGGPTAVINQSLYGIIRQAAKNDHVGRVLGAVYGVKGILEGHLRDLGDLDTGTIEGLRHAPGAALGSSRHKLEAADYPRILKVLADQNVRYFLYNGGNDSMDTADRVDCLARREGYELAVVGVPKTIDNDLSATDRCPGFGSAARYVAQSVRDVGMDVRSLPTPISIFEALGRNAGWLAAASALARTGPDSAPHLIYLPERIFDPQRFLADVESVYRRLGWAVVVVSEGVRRADGELLSAAADEARIDAFGHALPGDVASVLSQLVADQLKLRCRSEKPGLCGRSSMLHLSPVDQWDAEQVGRAAVDAALNGRGGQMVTLRPLEEGGTGLVALDKVANAEKTVPDEMIDSSGAFVTERFCAYARPLIGPALLEYSSLDLRGTTNAPRE